jgi:hypothetical protein
LIDDLAGRPPGPSSRFQRLLAKLALTNGQVTRWSLT